MRRPVTPAIDQEKNFELVRSGFFADGRFYSIEVSPHGYRWEARIVCVPGEKLELPQAIKLAGYKQELRRWAERLTVEEIQALAEGCG
jgi:hypothetical protein